MSIFYWYAYIIRCRDGEYIIGLTSRPELRWEMHAEESVAGNLPGYFSHVERFEAFGPARKREKEWLTWKKKKLEAYICGTPPGSLRFTRPLARLYESFGNQAGPFDTRWRREQAPWPAFFN